MPAASPFFRGRGAYDWQRTPDGNGGVVSALQHNTCAPRAMSTIGWRPSGVLCTRTFNGDAVIDCGEHNGNPSAEYGLDKWLTRKWRIKYSKRSFLLPWLFSSAHLRRGSVRGMDEHSSTSPLGTHANGYDVIWRFLTYSYHASTQLFLTQARLVSAFVEVFAKALHDEGGASC